MKPIGMLDIKSEFPRIEADVRRAIDDVLDSHCFIGGPQVGQLEGQLSEYLGCKHAVAVSSGTDAILLALMTCGVGPGDEVMTTPFTFFATAGCIHRTGARPVFVDIDPETFNIDSKLVEAAVTEKTKAIVPVHLFGQCAEMDSIQEVAGRHGLAVIEDAAQAIGARYRGGAAGTLGLAGCFSFYPTKNLGGFGEGGLISSDDDGFAVKCRQMRNHGQTSLYHHQFIGGNFRLDTMKAAILLVKSRLFEEFNERRRHNASVYGNGLANLPHVRLPVVPEYNHMVYHQYSILCERRDQLKQALTEASIGSGIYYPVPLHLQPCFSHLNYKKGDLPVSEDVANRILSLPVHPMLTDDDLMRVIDGVRSFYDGSSAE